MESRVDKHKKPAKTKGSGGGGKNRFWKSKKFKWTMGILTFLIVAVIGVYVYYIGHFLNAIHNPNNSEPVKSVDQWTGTDPVNIVLFGVDNRNNDPHPRSDSIIVVHIDPKTKTAKIMSVMRDTWYNIPDGNGYEKINAAMALGGPDLAVKTLKQFLQIPINYYVRTDFQGFIKIVDAIGGVDINVEKPLHYADDGVYDINLNAGEQHLDGKHALMYVRFRHDAMSDYARTERQRNFIKAVASQAITPGNLLKLPSILNSIEPYIQTNMTLDDMIKLGSLGASIDKSNIPTMQVPPMEDLKEGVEAGQDVLIPNVFASQKAVYQFLGLDPSTLVEDPSLQPPEYYEQNPVVPVNPKIAPDPQGTKVQPKTNPTPAPAPTPAPVPAPAPTPAPAPKGGGSGSTGGGTTGGGTSGGGSTSGSGGHTGGGGGTTTGGGGGTTTGGGGTTTGGGGTTTGGGGTTTGGGGTTTGSGGTTTGGGTTTSGK